jgi:hypothetical protein
MSEESLQPGMGEQFGVKNTVHLLQASSAANLFKKVISEQRFSLGRRHCRNLIGVPNSR